MYRMYRILCAAAAGGPSSSGMLEIKNERQFNDLMKKCEVTRWKSMIWETFADELHIFQVSRFLNNFLLTVCGQTKIKCYRGQRSAILRISKPGKQQQRSQQNQKCCICSPAKGTCVLFLRDLKAASLCVFGCRRNQSIFLD